MDEGGGVGRHPATRAERACGRLHLRPDRARLRADLQGDRAGELRPRRFDDARRLHLLHVHRLVRRGLLAGLCLGRSDHRTVRRCARRADPSPGDRPTAIRRGHAHHRSRSDLSQLCFDDLGDGDLHAADSVQRAPDHGRRRQRQPRICLDHHRHGDSLRIALRILHSYPWASRCRLPRRTSSPPITWASRSSDCFP